MQPKLIPVLYVFAIFYAVLSCLIREDGIILIDVIGFGLPMLFWLAMEWIAPFTVSVFMGMKARESFSKAMFGLPLVLLYSLVTPTIRGENHVIPSIIPWLAGFPSSLPKALPILQERMLLWCGVFIVSLIFAKISRLTHPSSGTR
ncbi:MAG: hypothetical protein WBC07_11340 [Methylotenera sp.]